jgi:hypothetical protein
MYFTAITSLSPKECQQTYHQDSQTLLAKFRHGAELAFARENLLLRMNLQFYKRSPSTLLHYEYTAKPGPRGLSLHSYSELLSHLKYTKMPVASTYHFFEAQQRSLLWWQIMILDVRCAEDRGTEPMIFDGSFNTSMPLNINDNDYGPAMSHVTHKSAFTFRKLLFPSQISVTEKEQMIEALSLEFESLYFQKCDANVPIQWFLSVIGRLLILKMWLSLRYPLRARDQPIYANATPDQTLRTAVLILEFMNLYENNPKSFHFKWVGRTWVQWHPLAVILAELCIQTEGPLIDRAWAVVESVWHKYGERVADTKGGMLWPMKRLLKKAQVACQEAATKREVQNRRHSR